MHCRGLKVASWCVWWRGGWARFRSKGWARWWRRHARPALLLWHRPKMASIAIEKEHMMLGLQNAVFKRMTLSKSCFCTTYLKPFVFLNHPAVDHVFVRVGGRSGTQIDLVPSVGFKGLFKHFFQLWCHFSRLNTCWLNFWCTIGLSWANGCEHSRKQKKSKSKWS